MAALEIPTAADVRRIVREELERVLADLRAVSAPAGGVQLTTEQAAAELAGAPLPPEIVELLRDVAAGPCTPDLRGRAGAALVRRDLVGACSRCGGSGYERVGDDAGKEGR